jgi:hypothetical protein
MVAVFSRLPKALTKNNSALKSIKKYLPFAGREHVPAQFSENSGEIKIYEGSLHVPALRTESSEIAGYAPVNGLEEVLLHELAHSWQQSEKGTYEKFQKATGWDEHNKADLEIALNQGMAADEGKEVGDDRNAFEKLAKMQNEATLPEYNAPVAEIISQFRDEREAQRAGLANYTNRQWQHIGGRTYTWDKYSPTGYVSYTEGAIPHEAENLPGYRAVAPNEHWAEMAPLAVLSPEKFHQGFVVEGQRMVEEAIAARDEKLAQVAAAETTLAALKERGAPQDEIANAEFALEEARSQADKAVERVEHAVVARASRLKQRDLLRDLFGWSERRMIKFDAVLRAKNPTVADWYLQRAMTAMTAQHLDELEAKAMLLLNATAASN